MSEYLTECLSILEGDFPNCGIILTGDFNHFNTSSIARQFKLKQLIKSPTRGSNTLDQILTNLHSFYKDANRLPPLGLSDHCTITIFPKRWWNEVKRISGHTPMSVNKDILSILALEYINVNDFSNNEIANHINDCFLDPQQSYVPLDDSDKIQYTRSEFGCDVLQVHEYDVFMKLKCLNVSKSPGPDGLQP